MVAPFMTRRLGDWVRLVVGEGVDGGDGILVGDDVDCWGRDVELEGSSGGLVGVEV